ncbi:chromate transporter [Prolixibacteraceae bacterium Z1-6]|uniref:Chromate transporter n=1 Tax=Draconibacterium aestuarii TaxID=2998507 RepID=A0A9X3F8Z7_9BACT|nr:chromate transporter [Prolixibacteraceae bacterium Z1-6]
MSKAKENVEMLVTFIKLGAVMFGGGYAMIPIMERDLVEKKKWLNHEELLDIMSLSQMTPGTIAINLATFIGNKRNGVLGGVIASLGIIIPSLVCVTALFYLLDSSMSNIYIVKVFTGIRACLAAMILHSVYKLFKAGIKGHIPFLIFLGALFALMLDFHPIYTILLGGAIGLSWKWLIPYFLRKKSSHQ